jgi:ribosomal protein S14
MLYLKKKDKKFRQGFNKFELKKKVLKFIKIVLIKKLNFFNVYLNRFNKYQRFLSYSKVKIKKRCVLTNRSKGISRLYSMSRIKMLQYLRLGLIPGYKKAVW